MKKINKLGTVALSMAVLASTTFATPMAQQLVSADDDSQASFSINQLQTTYEMEDGYIYIPTANGDATTTIYPMYSNTALQEGTDYSIDGGKIKLSPAYSAYKVEYELNGISKSFIINVQQQGTKLTLAKNSENYLPSSTAKGQELTIPYPVVTDDAGEALLKVDGTEYTTEELNALIDIEVTDPSGGAVTLSNGNKFTPNSYGTYSIKFIFNGDSENKVSGLEQAELSTSVKAVVGFKTERDLSMSIGSLPSMLIGKEYTLPTPTVKDETNNIDGVEVYTKIKVVCQKADKTSVDLSGDVKDFKFTPTEKGDYIITYEVSDIFGNKIPAATYRINNVKDTTNPEIKLVTGYETSAEDLDELEDYSYALQSKIALGSTLTLPAVYATDNATKDLSKLKITRTIQKSGKSSTAVTIEDIKDDGAETTKYKFNEVVEYDGINETGTWVVSYSVTDEAGNKTTKDFNVVVNDETWVDDVEPTITFEVKLPTTAKVGDVISFTEPTATDTSDTRLKLKVYYALLADFETKNVENWYEISKDNNSYSFTIGDFDDGSVLKVFAVATDDAGNQAIKDYSITIVNDTDASVIEVGDFDAGNSYNQGEVFNIPEIVVSDAYINGVNVKIEVFDSNNNTVNVYGETTVIANIDDKDVKKVTGARFYPTSSGDYQINVVATDVNNNVSIYSKKIVINGTTGIVVKIVKDELTADLSEEVDLNNFQVYKDGILIDINDEKVSIDVDGGSVSDDYKFKASNAGIYTVSVKYDGDVCATFSIIITAEKAPTVKFTSNTIDTEKTYSKNTEIKLPEPTITPAYDGNEYSYVVTVKKGSSVQYEYSSATGNPADLKFTPTDDGTYTIEYVVTEAVSNNTTTRTFEIIVGDKTGPEISLGDESVNAPSTMKKGSILTLNTNAIVIYDEYTKVTVDGSEVNLRDYENGKDGMTITITLKDADNKVVDKRSNEGFSWSLDKVGTYTLTYKATDSNGKTESKNVSIEVTDDAKETAKVGDTGMVLAIIGALIILAGVIVFFFKPESSKKEKKSKDKDAK